MGRYVDVIVRILSLCHIKYAKNPKFILLSRNKLIILA